jgi:probable HAF family extracellular repeat protein
MRFRTIPAILVAFALSAGCSDPSPTEPAGSVVAARAPRTTNGPTVSSTAPTGAPPGVTLDVRVLGSGFDAGTGVVFALGGVTGPGVVTNRTTFVSAQELVANITIDASAQIGLYDVIATTTGGKKGIGTEMFEVAFAATDLGAPRRGSSEAVAINNSNQIAGFDRYPDGTQTAFRWENGVKTSLPVTGYVRDINAQGWVLGHAYPRSWIWRPSTGVQWIDPPAGHSSFQAEAINDLGQVVGRASGGAFIWENGTFRAFLPAGYSGSPYDINNAGTVVGSAWASSRQGSFRWDAATGFSFLGGTPDGAEALSINDAGDITGWFEAAPGVHHAYRWRNGERLDLGVLKGPSSVGIGISNYGVVVGRDATAPFRWSGGSGLRPLGSVRTASTSGEARDVNDNEWIVGVAGGRATLWKPK